MENPYIVREKKNLFYVLPEDSCRHDIINHFQSNVLIIINLFYLDTIERYLKYLDTIPPSIQVYVVSSAGELLERVKLYIKSQKLNNVSLIKKKNRGRDISAFLVACREEIFQYKYMCFVHDKKVKQECLKQDTDFWIDNLWNNTLVSSEYIFNIIDTFERNKEIGLLVPPEPVGGHMPECFGDLWGGDYENTRALAEKLKLKCCMDAKFPPITLGTVFWCRTKALLKLFQVKWEYEDFEDEPLPVDGTLSHAIERILPFVAQDAGYLTGTVICNSYAKRLLVFLQDNMRKALDVLKYYFILDPMYDICKMNIMNMRIERIKKFCRENNTIYLYGAGATGKHCLKFLRMAGYEPKAFIVSEENYYKEVEGLKIISWKQLNNIENIGIIITVTTGQYHEEIINNLLERGFSNYISYARILELS